MKKIGYLGRFRYVSPGDVVGVGTSATDDIATGYYFMQGYTGESANAFMYSLDAAFTAAGATTPNCYIDMSLTYPRVVISLGASEQLFIANSLAKILGFVANSSSSNYNGTASYHIGTYPPRYCWFPDASVSFTGVDETLFWSPLSTTRTMRSVNGYVYTLVGNMLYGNMVKYTTLDKADVIKVSGSGSYRAFQSFFEDVMHEGERFRIIVDREAHVQATGYSSAAYETGVYGEHNSEVDEVLGDFTAFAYRNIDNYQGLWDLEFPMIKYDN